MVRTVMSFAVCATDLSWQLGHIIFLDHALSALQILSLDSRLTFLTHRERKKRKNVFVFSSFLLSSSVFFIPLKVIRFLLYH